MHRINLSTGITFASENGMSILEASALAHVLMSYSCRAGRCSACKCKVLNGKTVALKDELGLTQAEKADGWILSCVRSAESDVSLEVENLGGVVLPPPKYVPCRISGIDRCSPNVIRVYLRIPNATDFTFLPGQYVDVIGPNGVRRSYSLACASIVGKVLELHIRCVKGGEMSGYWFEQAKINDLLRLQGPFGTFFMRDTTDRDIIFLATGTGIAPIKAMLEAVRVLPADRIPRSVTVFWGGRSPEDVYFDMTTIEGSHKFVPVLSRAAPDWLGERGYIQNVLLASKPNIAHVTVYACGSNAMIHDAQTLLAALGLPAHRFFSDAFVCSATSTSK